MEKTPKVSVIISTKNEALNLPRLLKSLKQQTYQDLEIIIVDNFSTDTTLKIARQYILHTFTHGGERSAQRNYGAEHARGHFLLFLDADMELPSTVVLQCVNEIKKPQRVALIIPETTRGSGWFTRIKHLEKQLYLSEPLIEAARFFKKPAFLKVGGYNESLIAAEDWDLSKRIAALGTIGRIETSLYHYETSFVRELTHKWYYASKMSAYAKLHPHEYFDQSGTARLKILWRKRKLLFNNPLPASGLIIVKAFEFILYRCAILLNK